MDELANIDDKKNLLGLFHGKGTDVSVPNPYERDIFLSGIRVAGTMYVENIEEIAAKLEVGSRLNLYREPNNEYDKLAIVIKTLEDEKIGYVRRRDNPVLARLMDAGKNIFGKVTDVYKYQRNESYFRNRIADHSTDDAENVFKDCIGIEVDIYMHED